MILCYVQPAQYANIIVCRMDTVSKTHCRYKAGERKGANIAIMASWPADAYQTAIIQIHRHRREQARRARQARVT